MRHGYAVTVHKAQGLTCEHGLLLAPDETRHEMGYVGLSRGTLSNRLYAVSTETDADLEPHHRKVSEPERDSISLVTESMTKGAAKDLALLVSRSTEADVGFEL